ncbi:reverse transcriptase (RNA-dependent DNA polymerase) domain-containing protein [Phthorimaea operculella]|nr:reverse transcriptase (RNA-dependent DNA polymerase) domain-containing protein [Phthorimaea operculella]
MGDERVHVTKGVEPFVPADAYHPPLSIRVSCPIGVLPPSQSQQAAKPRDGECPAWNFKKADYCGLYEALSSIDWTDVLAITDVDIAVQTLYTRLYECFNEFVPLKKEHKSADRYVYPSWYTPEIIHNIKQKFYHLKMHKTTGAIYNRELFKYYRWHVKNLIDYAYQQHIDNVQKSIISDPTKFWGYVGDKRDNRGQVKSFIFNGVEVTGQDAANAFASYFSSVFHVNAPQLDASAAASAGYVSSDAATISLDSLREADLLAAVKRLKPRSSTGPDGVPSFVLKDCVSALKVPLLHIYNMSLKMSVYPKLWKTSIVTPVPKTSSANDVTNFRPIAVPPLFGKVFETMIDRYIRVGVDSRLDDSQHGFRSARSTNTNHINFVDSVSTQMETFGQVDATYFDFKKAFDLVDNDILLRKMASFGFTPKLLLFFASYLRDRSQFVRVASCLDTLMLRRRLLLVTHYFGLLNNRINNISVTERIGLVVPSGGTRSCCGYEPPRRRHRLFARENKRTRRADNAPTARALSLLSDIAMQYDNIDVFADSERVFLAQAYIHLCELNDYKI